jgi:hypothetical protein
MAIDKNTLLRDGSTALTATEATPTAVDFRGEDMSPLYYQVDVPSATGTSPTADIVIEGSNTSSTTGFETITAFPQITSSGQYVRRAIAKYRWRRAKITVGGTTPNFGNVTVSVVPAGRYTVK